MKYYHIALFIGTLASVATGCKDETWNYEDHDGTKHGTLSSRSIEYEVNAAAIVSRAASTDDFIVELTDGTEVIDRYTYSELPNEIEMEVGSYGVRVHSPEIYKAAWEAPYYEGTQSFTIKEDATTEVEKVICRLANIKVSVRMSDEFRRLVSDDCKLTVIANDNGELVYTLDDIDNGRAGFFEYVETSQTLVATLECKIEGEPVTFNTIYTDVEPGQHRIIYYDLGGEDPEIPDTPIDPGNSGDNNDPGNNGDNNDPGNNGDNNDPGNNGDNNDPGNNGDNNDPGNNGDNNDPGNNGDNNDPNVPEQPGDDNKPENPTPSGSLELGNGIIIDSSVTIEDLTIGYKTDADETQSPAVNITDPDYKVPEMPNIPGGNGTTNDPYEPFIPVEPEDPTPVKPVDPKPVDPTPVDPTPVVPDDPTPVEPEPEPFPAPDSPLLNGLNDVKEGEDYVIKITSTYGFANLEVIIDSDGLTADVLESVGLKATFDLAYPGELEEGLSGLGFPIGSEVIGQTGVTFDITQFVPFLSIYPDRIHTFILNMKDAKGNDKKIKIKFKS